MRAWALGLAIILFFVPTFNWTVGNVQNEAAAGLWIILSFVFVYIAFKEEKK